MMLTVVVVVVVVVLEVMVGRRIMWNRVEGLVSLVME